MCIHTYEPIFFCSQEFTTKTIFIKSSLEQTSLIQQFFTSQFMFIEFEVLYEPLNSLVLVAVYTYCLKFNFQ